MKSISKWPFIQWFVQDWLADPKVSLCDARTRGILFDWLCNMHSLDRSGSVTGTREILAQLGRCTVPECDAALQTLIRTNAADVQERNGLVTVTNRRMKREALARKYGASRVKRHRCRGPCNADVTLHNLESRIQNPEQEKRARPKPPSIEAVKLQGAKIGLPDDECEKFFDYYGSNGWRVGKNPMRLWTAALANWKRHWVEYSGGNIPAKGTVQLSADTFWKDKARLDMVEKEVHAIEGRASHTAMDIVVEPRDRESYKRLKAERRELKTKMKL